jgi:hypothetical protein
LLLFRPVVGHDVGKSRLVPIAKIALGQKSLGVVRQTVGAVKEDKKMLRGQGKEEKR